MSSALARGDRAVIADPDGGYLRRFFDIQRGDIVLNPFNPRSLKWDLFAEIKNPHDVEQLARSLIPDHEGQDRSWRSYARTFFTAVTRQAYDAGMTDVAELYRLLVISEAGELRALVRGTPAQPFLNEDNSRMFDSIRSVTSSAVAALDYIGQQKADGFSVREWVKDESAGVLFIPYKAGEIAALRSTISGWMRLAIFEAMNQDDEQHRPLWFVVDELDALGQIDGLKDALARFKKIQWPMRTGFPIAGAGVEHVRGGRCSHPGRELRQYADLTMFRQRGRRHRPVCLPAHRRARGTADHAVEEPPGHGNRRFGIAEPAFQHRARGAALAGGTARRPHRLFEICV